MEVKSGSVRTQAANTSTQSTVKLNLQICAAMVATKMPNPLEVSKVTRLLRNLQGQGLRRRVCPSGHRIVSWQAIKVRSDSKSTNSSRHSSSNSNSNSSSCHRSTKSTLIPGSSSLSKKRVPIASAAQTTTTRQNKRRQLNKEACLYNKWTTSTWIANWTWPRKAPTHTPIHNTWNKTRLATVIKDLSTRKWTPSLLIKPTRATDPEVKVTMKMEDLVVLKWTEIPAMITISSSNSSSNSKSNSSYRELSKEVNTQEGRSLEWQRKVTRWQLEVDRKANLVDVKFNLS